MAVVLATSVRVAGSDATEPMAKLTNLSAELAATACRNYSLLPLVETWGFEPTIATAYDYDESRSPGPRGARLDGVRVRGMQSLNTFSFLKKTSITPCSTL